MLRAGPDPEIFEQQAKNLGLDQPIHIQYFHWIGDLLQGDLGYTFKNHIAISDLLWPRIGNTIILMGAAWLVSLLDRNPLGILNSTKVYGLSDQTASFISYLGLRHADLLVRDSIAAVAVA